MVNQLENGKTGESMVGTMVNIYGSSTISQL